MIEYAIEVEAVIIQVRGEAFCRNRSGCFVLLDKDRLAGGTNIGANHLTYNYFL